MAETRLLNKTMKVARFKNKKSAQSGAAMLEYAVCFPIFIGIVLALLYILRWFYSTSVLQYASYEAGRMLSQSEILAVPEVDYCGNGASLSDLDSSCVTFYNNLKAATDKADTILRTLLGGGAYSQLKTYKLYDREAYQQYGYTIPMGFPTIETKLLFLRPGEVAKDTEGNLINHTNREPGQKVTSSTQCLNRTTGWPSPLCGNQKMQDIMRDKPFIVSAQVNESYAIPLMGRQVFPAIGTQVFYAAGSEVVKEIQQIPTATPTSTPTNRPITVTPTPTPTPTPTFIPPPDSPITPDPPPDESNPYAGSGSDSPVPCDYHQNWTISYMATERELGTCEKLTCEWEPVYKIFKVCRPVGTIMCSSPWPGVTCSPLGADSCSCCDQGFYSCNCDKFGNNCTGCWEPPICSIVTGSVFYEEVCEDIKQYTHSDQICTTTLEPCMKERSYTWDDHQCTIAGNEPSAGSSDPNVVFVVKSPVGNPYLACSCGGGPCQTWCTGGTGAVGCRNTGDCLFSPCWNPASGRFPSCDLNMNVSCQSQCG